MAEDVKKAQPATAAAVEEAVPVSVSPITKLGAFLIPPNKYTAIAWAPDGSQLATGAADGSVGLVEVRSGRFRLITDVHYSEIASLSWSPDGRTLAATSIGGTIRLMATLMKNESTIPVDNMAVFKAAWLRDGKRVATVARNGSITVWDTAKGKLAGLFKANLPRIRHIAQSADFRKLAMACSDGRIVLFDIEEGRELGTLAGHTDRVISLAWAPDAKTLASSSGDTTIRVWDVASLRQETVLEGHAGLVMALAYCHDGSLLAAQSQSGAIPMWRTASWEVMGTIDSEERRGLEALAFHPKAPMLATITQEQTVRGWKINAAPLPPHPDESRLRSHYRSAKVVLVGDSGAGKSGLALRLMGQAFAPTESTHGRRVYTIERSEILLDERTREIREVLLWDMAGQPGYRMIHQLHLDEVSAALVVFDCRGEGDPFAGVGHWHRGLRTARHLEGNGAPPLKKFLVATRTDRGGIDASRDRVQRKVEEFGFDGFFETSAKEGWGIDELRAALRAAIPWDLLPKVASDAIFQNIKDFLVAEKEKGRLITSADDLYNSFRVIERREADKDFRQEFDTCIRLVEARDLIRRLSFGNLVLLQPEYLDAYASAVVEAARADPEGLGSLAEEAARSGRFKMPQAERIPDPETEKLLLMVVVEDLLKREIALREPGLDGPQLVFPSQITREAPQLEDLKGVAVVFEFEGPVDNIYATLTVRLSHSGLFRKVSLWRDGVEYEARSGGRCGFVLKEQGEGRGELSLFFDAKIGRDTRFHFEDFIQGHLVSWAMAEHVSCRRVTTCPSCGEPLPERQILARVKSGQSWITCGGCDAKVTLGQDAAASGDSETTAAMAQSADAARDLAAGLAAATAEVNLPAFEKWAGGSDVTLALVFTDVVGSTSLNDRLGNERMEEVRLAHFAQARKLTAKFGGYEIKTIGDSFMLAFRTALGAFDFSLELHADPGPEGLGIRAGIDVGTVHIHEGDVFGHMVNYTARIEGLGKGAEIWVSDRVKRDIDYEKARRHESLEWLQQVIEADDKNLKGFTGTHVVWTVTGTDAQPAQERGVPSTFSLNN